MPAFAYPILSMAAVLIFSSLKNRGNTTLLLHLPDFTLPQPAVFLKQQTRGTPVENKAEYTKNKSKQQYTRIHEIHYPSFCADHPLVLQKK